MLYEECNQHAENFVSNVFKENCSLPIYDEYEEDSKWDSSLCSSNSENLCQEELCLAASIGEKTDISAETYKENEVFNS